MSTPPRKEDIGKHFQNDQRRHSENQADSSQSIAGVNLRNYTTARYVGQSTATNVHGFSSARSQAAVNSGISRSGPTRMTAVSGLNLPEPVGINREFLIALQSIPEHLREQVLFNMYNPRTFPHHASEEYNYAIERKKDLARAILRKIAEEIPMEDKLVERILDSFEPLLY